MIGNDMRIKLERWVIFWEVLEGIIGEFEHIRLRLSYL